MAYTKITNWLGSHNVKDVAANAAYYIYVDNATVTNKPYMTLGEYELRGLTANSRSQITNHAPFTVKIQINGKGTVYSFDSGSEILQGRPYPYTETGDSLYWEIPFENYNNKYFVTFSSTKHIPLPMNGEQFTINTTILDKNGTTLGSFVETALGPYPNNISGSASLNTGSVYTYTLKTPVSCTGGKVYEEGIIMESQCHYSFPSYWQRHYIDGYTDKYTQTIYASRVTKISFAPYNYNNICNAGEKCDTTLNVWVEYRSKDTCFGSNAFRQNNHYNDIVIMKCTKDVTITSRKTYDAELEPEIEYVGWKLYDIWSEKFVDGEPDKKKYGAYLGGSDYQSPYYHLIEFKSSEYYGYLPYGAKLIDQSYSVSNADGFTVQGFWPMQPYYSVAYIYFNTAPFNNVRFSHTAKDLWGRSWIFTDTFNVIEYKDPEITSCSVDRCRLVSKDDGSGKCYKFNNKVYKLDEYGEYCLYRYSTKVTPLNNKNTIKLEIVRRGMRSTWNAYDDDNYETTKTAPVTSYTYSGYVIGKIGTERSFTVNFILTDDKHSVARRIPLNTIPAMLDFKRGWATEPNSGVAFGKVSELDDAVEVARTWTVRLPENVTIINYDNNGNNLDFYQWAAGICDEIDKLKAAQRIIVFSGSTFYGGLSLKPINSYTNVKLVTENNNSTLTMSVHGDHKGGGKLSKPIKISKRYLKVSVSFEVYGGTPYRTLFYPKIYLSTAEPTSINQSTGDVNVTAVNTIIPDGVLHGRYDKRITQDNLVFDDTPYDFSTYRSSPDQYRRSSTVVFDLLNYQGKSLWLSFSFSGYNAEALNNSDMYMELSNITMSPDR